MSDHLNPAILTMSLAELRERVELAERLAIASRFASTALSTGPAASAASAAGTANGAQGATLGKGQDDAGAKAAADKAAKEAAAKKAAADKAAKDAAAKAAADKTAAAQSATSDDLTSAFGEDEFSAGGDEGDMLAGFVEELTPEQAKASAIEIAKQVIAKKDKSELASAREIMQKFSVSKVSDIPDGRAVEAHQAFKAAFPQYGG